VKPSAVNEYVAGMVVTAFKAATESGFGGVPVPAGTQAIFQRPSDWDEATTGSRPSAMSVSYV
jgi:hypothetical protein